ncbi:hypothetical protein M9435_004536 [Picochlorum sp. BPE23]|nr:hypothetical protein M9435_004536 [Picochlorum sp. BPE23]
MIYTQIFSIFEDSTFLKGDQAKTHSISSTAKICKETRNSQFSGAYAVYVASQDYVLGAKGLFRSIRKTGSNFEVIALVLDDFNKSSMSELRAIGYKIVQVNPIKYNVQGADIPVWSSNSMFSILHLFNLSTYSRIVKLDVDMLVLRNIDELFYLGDNILLAGVGTSSAGRVGPGWILPGLQYFKGDAEALNGGMYSLVPSSKIFERMMVKLAQDEQIGQRYGNFEQSFLSAFFKEDFFRLDPMYNVRITYAIFNPELWSPGEMKIFHFVGPNKPWLRDSYRTSKPSMPTGILMRYQRMWWEILGETPDFSLPLFSINGTQYIFTEEMENSYIQEKMERKKALLSGFKP